MRSPFSLLNPALAVLAACSFQPGAYSDGDGSVAIDDTGSGSGSGSDSGSGSGDADSDGDGHVDASDNCVAVANTDQRDHDGDARGDACDGCPHLPSATEPDGDGDGIGDACDPRPATAGDSLAVWEGFYDDTGYADWEDVGTWTVANGLLTQADDSVTAAYAYLPTQLTRASLTVGTRVLSLGSGAIPRVAIYTGSAGQAQGYSCQLEAGTTNTVEVYGYWPGNGQQTDSDGNTFTWLGTFDANSEVRLTDEIVGTQHRCIATQGTTATTLTANHGPSTGVIVLVTERAAASFDYVFVVNVGI